MYPLYQIGCLDKDINEKILLTNPIIENALIIHTSYQIIFFCFIIDYVKHNHLQDYEKE